MRGRGEGGATFVLERVQALPQPVHAVFAFFSDPTNLETITPTWLRFRIVEAPERLERGSLLRYRLSLFGVPISWRTLIAAWQPPRSFTDIQLSGPYPLWEHTHRFSPLGDGTEVYDHVRYRVPGGPLAPFLQAKLVGRWLDDIFDYRRERLARLLGDSAAGEGSSVSKDASRP
ncbi:MAG: SRPBCC family protein [Actinomycetota bacterium]|nr:SRPBCC family protein [Actinomycetota bacterium]